MKEPPDSELHWEKLVARARTDLGPPADRTALLRAVRAASSAPVTSWAAEISAVFSSGRLLSGCLAAAGAFAVVASWEAWETWQALPWAQWVAITGGVP